MKERSLHRDPSPSPLRWLRAWLGRASDPPLPRPPRPRLRPVWRVGPLAVWEARSAVVARVPLADFLRARLARYEARMGLPLARLPVRVELAEDEIRSTPVEAPSPAPPAAPGDAGLAALVALEGPAVERRVAEAAARLAALEREEAAARARAEAIALRLATDVAGGAVAAAPDPSVAPHALGRPRVRTPAVLGALAGAAAAATLAEAWAVGVPMLRAIDGYPPRIEPGHDLAALALVGGSALGVAVGLVALSLVALATLAGPGPASSRTTRRRFAGWGAAASLVAAGLTAAATAAPVEGAPSALRQALLLLALPTGAALAVRTAQREHAARMRDREAALAWDRTLATALAARGRRLEELAVAESQARAAAQRSRGARRELRRLRARAEAAARLVAGAARRDREAGFRLALSLAGALERDRYEYLRQATARGLVELTPAARGAPPEARPAAGEAEGEGRVAV